MRKFILNLAMSMDGYICDPEGGFNWIKGQGDKTLDSPQAYSFKDFIEGVDTIIMGANSYEDVVLSGLDAYDGFKVYVASHRPLDLKPYVTLIEGDLVDFVKDLKGQEGKDIWLFGGGNLIDQFLQGQVVDEYHLATIPVLLGQGRPVFKQGQPYQELHLISHSVEDGIITNVYVNRQS